MEVAAGCHLPVGEDHRVVDGAGQLAGRDSAHVIERVPPGADYLGSAAQRIGILNPGVVQLVGRHDARAGQHAEHVGGRDHLARLGSQGRQLGPEGLVGAEEGFHGHGGGHFRVAEQSGRVLAGQAELAEHAIRTVDQGQALLGGQHEGRDPGLLKGSGGGGPSPVRGDDVALARERQGRVGQGSQVAAAPQRAVLANDRGDPGVEERDERVHDQGTDPRVALGQRGRSQQHHGPHRFRLDLFAHGRGVRADQADLQDRPLLGRDVAVGERPEPGRQPVHRRFTADQLHRHRVGAVECVDGFHPDLDWQAEAGYPDHVGDAQPGGGQHH